MLPGLGSCTMMAQASPAAASATVKSSGRPSQVAIVLRSRTILTLTSSRPRFSPPAMTVVRLVLKLTLKTLALYLDPTLKIARALGVKVMPSTFLFDDKGHELGKLEGAAEWDVPEAIDFMKYFIDNLERLCRIGVFDRPVVGLGDSVTHVGASTGPRHHSSPNMRSRSQFRTPGCTLVPAPSDHDRAATRRRRDRSGGGTRTKAPAMTGAELVLGERLTGKIFSHSLPY